MRLSVLSDARFTCRSCTHCCRDWHVELLGDEIDSVRRLAWPPGDPLSGANPLFRHGGKTYLAHRADGACIFLNPGNGLCRIHEQFGGDAKPLGCRLYPFQITPTFDDQATVTARYDCPTVRRNDGLPHADAVAQLRTFAARMPMPPAFDETTRCHLDHGQIEAVCEFAGTLMGGFAGNDQRALFIASLCDWLSILHNTDLDREALAGAFGVIKERVDSAIALHPAMPGPIHRMAFRTLLALYLRRDEDVLNGRASRAKRLIAMAKVVFGFGDFTGLGVSHPPGRVNDAGLFSFRIAAPDAETFSLHWQMIRAKLESLQFMGSANRGRDFLTGLRSLALLYPLVLAAAKVRAAGRGSTTVDATDVDYAVGAIGHSFGRSAVLALPFVKSIETLLVEPVGFTRLVTNI